MLADIVIDTNVLMHADDPRQGNRDAIVKLFGIMKTKTTALCVDEGFDLNEAKNKSYIAAEYLKWLTFGGLGFGLVAYLASNGRVKFTTRKVSVQTRNVINQASSDNTDRVFIQVALNSEEKAIASHDKKNFNKKAVRKLKNDLGVFVGDASEILKLLA